MSKIFAFIFIIIFGIMRVKCSPIDNNGTSTTSIVAMAASVQPGTPPTRDPEAENELTTSVSPTTTSPQQPISFRDTAIYQWQNSIEEYVDKSCPITSIQYYFNESEQKCISLEESLLENEELGVFWLLSFRSLYHSGILNGTIPAFDSTTPMSTSLYPERDETCKELKKVVDRRRLNGSGNCRWKYECKFNPHYFPSATLEAMLLEDDDDCMATQHDHRFVRVPRRNNAHQDCWFPCHAATNIMYQPDLKK